MSNEIKLDIAGQLTKAQELRFTQQGKAVASFTVAVNSAYRDNDGKWVEREPVFFDCVVWGEQAERAAERLTAGDRVIVKGQLVGRSFTATQGERAGQTIRRQEIQVDEIGVSLLRADVQVTRIKRDKAGS